MAQRTLSHLCLSIIFWYTSYNMISFVEIVRGVCGGNRLRTERWIFFEYALYALCVAAYATYSQMQGELYLEPRFNIAADQLLFNSGTPLVFGIVFIASVALFYVLRAVDALIKRLFLQEGSGRARRFSVFILMSALSAFILFLYSDFLFSSPGSWIISGGRGMLGSLGNVWIDTAFFFVIVLIARWMLVLKRKLHKYCNTHLLIPLLFIFLFAPMFNHIINAWMRN